DSNFTPCCVLFDGEGSESYLAMTAVPLATAGGTLSVSSPCCDGHIPPVAGFVPQAVAKPNRACASAAATIVRTASLIIPQAVSLAVPHGMSVPVDRHVYMLPERSTSTYTVGARGWNTIEAG